MDLLLASFRILRLVATVALAIWIATVIALRRRFLRGHHVTRTVALWLLGLCMLMVGDRLHGSAAFLFRDAAPAPWPQVVDLLGYALIGAAFVSWAREHCQGRSLPPSASARRPLRPFGAAMLTFALIVGLPAASTAGLLHRPYADVWPLLNEMAPFAFGAVVSGWIGIEAMRAGRRVQRPG